MRMTDEELEEIKWVIERADQGYMLTKEQGVGLVDELLALRRRVEALEEGAPKPLCEGCGFPKVASCFTCDR